MQTAPSRPVTPSQTWAPLRLGAQSSDVASRNAAPNLRRTVVTERHRHRYEANVNYLPQLRAGWSSLL
jgi:CTP synthase (UTP-ammonia lyase)